MKRNKPFDRTDNAWADLNPFIEAGGIVPEVRMHFNDVCANIRRQHNTSEGAFKRALFRVLQDRCNLSSFAEVAERFLFDGDAIPVDEVEEAPEIAAELRAANDDLSAAETKRELAIQRANAAAQRLRKIDALTEELPRLKSALAYLEGLPAIWKEDIENAERAIHDVVYAMPGYTGIGHPDAFIVEKQRFIEAAKAAIASHPARLAKAREKIDGVRSEIAELKGKKSKKA
jgi:hypothetical protein